MASASRSIGVFAGRNSTMVKFTVAQLASYINNYIPTKGHPNRVTVKGLGRVAPLLEVEITGNLLKKQLAITIDAQGKRSFRLAAQNGKYKRTTGDGDLHFCVGTQNNAVHVPCEIQAATNDLILEFNDHVGEKVSVTGFFRCLFEHSGIVQTQNSDCHIFEIHPVRAVTLGGTTHTFEVDAPAEPGIHDGWMRGTVSLEDTDKLIKIRQQPSALAFEGVQSDVRGGDVNYVRVRGAVRGVKTLSGEGGALRFTFTIDDTGAHGKDVECICLPHTSASRDAHKADGHNVTLVALRNINLKKALTGKYVINLLAIQFEKISS
jgi:hypothetical protein